MIPVERFTLKEDGDKYGEYGERDDLLYHLQLHQGIGASVASKTDSVGGHLTHILRHSQKPREEYHDEEGCVIGEHLELLHLKMSIPRECHENVGDYEQSDCVQLIHFIIFDAKVRKFIENGGFGVGRFWRFRKKSLFLCAK